MILKPGSANIHILFYQTIDCHYNTSSISTYGRIARQRDQQSKLPDYSDGDQSDKSYPHWQTYILVESIPCHIEH